MQIIENGQFNDALKYWVVNKSQFPELAHLAKEFLTIPATQVPSERVWSRAVRVIRAKRFRLNPEVMARMMFAQENSELIQEHWNNLNPNVKLPDCYLPLPVNDLDKDGYPTDVGQDDDVVVVAANPTDLGQNDDDVLTFESNFT